MWLEDSLEKCLALQARPSMSIIVGVGGALEWPLTGRRGQSTPVFRLINLMLFSRNRFCFHAGGSTSAVSETLVCLGSADAAGRWKNGGLKLLIAFTRHTMI